MAKGQQRSRVLPPLPGQEPAARAKAEQPAEEAPAEAAPRSAKGGARPGRTKSTTSTARGRTTTWSSTAESEGETTSALPAQPAAPQPEAASEPTRSMPVRPAQRPTQPEAPARPASEPRARTARLRLVQVDPWSVMKTAFLLSIAIGIISVVAVGIVWGILGAAGVWDSVNSTVQQTVGSESGKPFDITDYVGTSRVLGFTMIAAVIDVVLITAIATLGAFLYNLAATLVGGIEVTLSEDR
jgi:hypothetical protein